MNITNSLPIIYSNPNPKSRLVDSNERDNIRVKQTSNNQKENVSSQQSESVRVIRVASEGLKIAEFGSKYQTVNNGRLSSSAKPEQQYQSNQGLLERQEIGELVGIDLFA